MPKFSILEAFTRPVWPGFTARFVWPNRRRSTRISSAMVSDGVPGDVQCAMRCVYVREGEFSGSTRGFRLSGSDRLETILECDGDDETRSGSRSFLLQRQRVDGGDER